MTEKILECVPNFSEGRDPDKIKEITHSISRVNGIRMLHVDPGISTNRTVVTFIGDPESVIEAAFNGIKTAAELLDMRHHSGKHPRIGATDVCPLVPLRGISMDEAVEYARILGNRVGEELGIPGYFYEYAALSPERRNLANCRKGEYEGLVEKIKDPAWKPDFGPVSFNARAGATAIGARNLLVAYNINLDSPSIEIANAIVSEIREKGRIKGKGNRHTGEIARNENHEPVYIPGSLKAVKGIGWYIEEYGIAQVSLNLTNIKITPIHIAFEEVYRRAEIHGIRVTGSEIIGLVPLDGMLEAGKYYLNKINRADNASQADLIEAAIKSLGLNDLNPFIPEERIIEYML
jgi:glutamate formiminotransferase/formiminotetrahydrofolate cyclodeaminase